MSSAVVEKADCLEFMRAMPDDSVDLVIESPPYGKARRYGELQFKLTGQDCKNHIEQVKLQLSREPRELPRLMFSSQLDVGIEGLLSWRWSDIHLVNYRPHPKIEAEVAV